MPKFKYRNKHRKNKNIVKDNSFTEIALTKMAKKQLTITLCSIFGVTLLTMGSAFSIFTTQAVGEDQVIKVGTLNIDFGEDADGTLSLTGNYPMEDAAGQATTPYTFTITNTGSLEAYYTVKLEDDTEMIEQESCTGSLIDKNQVKYSIDAGTPGILGEIAANSNIIDQGFLASGASKTYSLRLWIKEKAPNIVLNRHYHGKIVVEGVDKGGAPKPTAVETLLANYTNGEDVQDYDVNYTKTDPTAKENKMYVFDHASNKGTQQSDWSSDELKDYRYIGANPNNYVTFNEEMWRIIGIETVDDGSGTKEKRIKLIKNDPLPVGTNNYISFDNKTSGTGSSESSSGSNDWTDSRLMMVLNPGYDSDPLATGGKGSLYWNRQSGSCPLGSSDGTTSCDFTSTGLKEETQKLIGDAKWYLGAPNGTNYEDASNGTANHFYSYERGETVYSSSEHPRKTSWTGKVGLMYPSDYGYATSGGTSKTRDTCLSDTVYNYDAEDCKNNDWLLDSSKNQWTIAPCTDYSDNVFRVHSVGYVSDYYASDGNHVARPVVYLVSNIQLLKGTGAENDPFEFGL